MTLERWLLFFTMETALSLSPGPAVFYVVAQGTRGGMRGTLPAAAGILSANAVYFALSATSLGAMIATSARFFMVAKWLGAAYLSYLGVRALLESSGITGVELQGAGAVQVPPARQKAYTGALTLQLANPKALLSFLALLPQFIDLKASVAPQMAILAATSMLPEFFILLGYGWLSHRAALASEKLGMSGGLNRWLARIEGVGLLACAFLVVRYARNS